MSRDSKIFSRDGYRSWRSFYNAFGVARPYGMALKNVCDAVFEVVDDDGETCA